MPQIPGAFQGGPRVQADALLTPRVQAQAPAAAFGISDAGARGAAQLGQAADSLQREAIQAGNEERVARRTELGASAATRLAELRDQIETNTDPEQMRELWRTGSEAIVRDLGATAGNDQRWATSYLQSHVAQDAPNVNRLIRTRVREAGVGALNDGLATFARVADAARTPEARAQAITQAGEAIDAAAAVGTIGRDDAQRIRARFSGQMEFTALNRLVGDNPTAGLAMARDTSRNQNLTPEQRLQLEDRAQAGQQRLADMAAAAATRAEAVAQATERRGRVALANLEPFAARGRLDPGAVERTAVAVRGTESEPGFRRMIANASVNAEFARLPLAQQAERIAEADAAISRPGATVDDIQQADRLRNVAHGVATAYRQDPYAAAAVYGVIPGPLPPVNLADPATVDARVQAAQTIRAARPGLVVPIFTQAEETALVQRFAQGSAPQRADIIRGMNGIQDPDVRIGTFRRMEDAIGPGGRTERGTLTHVGRMLASPDSQDQREGMRVLDLLQRDTSERIRAPGDQAALSAAMQSIQTSGFLGVLSQQAQLAQDQGGGAYANMRNSALGTIEQMARARVAENPSLSYPRAVQLSVESMGRTIAPVAISGLANVLLYGGATEVPPLPIVEAGFQALRTRAAAERTSRPGSDAILAAGSIRQGVWINVGAPGNPTAPPGQHFALIAPGANGRPEVVTTATLSDIVAAGGRARRAEEALPAFNRREILLERERRGSRNIPVPAVE